MRTEGTKMITSHTSMNRYSFFLFISIGIGILFLARRHLQKPHKIVAIDFDDSMQVNAYQSLLADHDTANLLQIFKQIYDQHKYALNNPAIFPKIPTILHVIWLGGKLPREYEGFYHSWQTSHPSWTHIFWTDHPANYELGTVLCKTFEELSACLASTDTKGLKIVVDTAGLIFDNKKFFNASRYYGEKSDILRWEVVYRFGGVYVDTDFECFHPLDNLNHCFDFYTGLQPLDINHVQLGAALFGAIPGHPIMQECIQKIQHNQHIMQIIARTGPIHFTRCFLSKITERNLINIALPASYFYPCGYEQKALPKSKWTKSEALAVHHWAGSWRKPESFVRS